MYRDKRIVESAWDRNRATWGWDVNRERQFTILPRTLADRPIVARDDREPATDRLLAFSDGVFAVVITLLVLELRPPLSVTWFALTALWPTGLSYAVSYLFIAIVWINHHHLLRFADKATARLVWANFAHLFSVSLIPFATAWLAGSRLAAFPVATYAAVFVFVNATYLALWWEAIDRPAMPRHVRSMMQVRSLGTLVAFTAAGLIALKSPASGMTLICLCLLLYLRPDPVRAR